MHCCSCVVRVCMWLYFIQLQLHIRSLSQTHKHISQVVLDIKEESRAMLWPKTKLSWLHTYEKFGNDYDWYVCMRVYTCRIQVRAFHTHSHVHDTCVCIHTQMYSLSGT